MATAAPTTLQVNASTQQAVGAFNQLASSIAAAHQRFAQMGSAMSQANQAAQRYGGSLQAIQSGFAGLTKIVGGAIDVVRNIAGGIEFVFSSIVKELDKLQGFNAIMSVTTKSTEDVAKSYDFLRGVADKLGVQFDSLTNNYAKLVAALPQGEKGLRTAETVFLGIAEAARTLHASNSDIQLMFYAITQMASKGTVSMEELRRQLGEKLPGTMQIAARSLNTLPETLEAAIRKGVVSSEKFLPIFGATLVRTFAEPAEKASTSVSASLNRLTNVWTDFVKNILDSGAGQSIANVFDAIREKLSDPYIIERFSELVKYLGDRFTDFVKSLTAEDMRKGFDSFSHAIQVVIVLIEKLISMFEWIINHGAAVGAIVGGIAGVAVGARAGPWGALAGGVAGAAGGYYAGKQLTDTGSEEQKLRDKYNMSDAAVAQRQQDLAEQQAQYKVKILTGPLQQFKGLNNLNDLDKLFDASRLNQKTVDDLNRLLQDKSFKTDNQRLEGLKDYAKYGTVLPPQTSTLADVMGPGKNKVSAEEKSLNATWNRANGLNANYTKELANLNKLYQSGRLDMDSYVDAVQDLIEKQPFAIELAKQDKVQRELDNKSILENWKSYDQQQKALQKLNESISEEMRLAGLSAEDRQAESQVIQATNSLKEVGLTLSDKETAALREQYKLIIEINKVSQAREQFLQATVNRLESQVNMLKGIDSALQDPTTGATKQDATNFVVGQNPDMFKGTQEYYEFQKSQADDMFSYLEALRERDFISTETYNRLKTQTQIKLYQDQVDAANYTFGTLSTLMKSKSREAFEIGKAASVAQALISAYEAINKAWTLPYPFNIAAAAAVGVATFANVRAIASTQMGSYQSGGYTGDAPVNKTVGVVHGKEFVANAHATSKYRPVLEAMNSGRWPVMQMTSPDVKPVGGSFESVANKSIQGFAGGGYTGDGAMDRISGVTHGQEYVVNANATARHRATLEAMNSGRYSGESSGNVNVIVNNNASGTKATTQERQTPNGKEIEVTITEVVARDIRRGGQIAKAAESQYGLNRAAGAVR